MAWHPTKPVGAWVLKASVFQVSQFGGGVSGMAPIQHPFDAEFVEVGDQDVVLAGIDGIEQVMQGMGSSKPIAGLQYKDQSPRQRSIAWLRAS